MSAAAVLAGLAACLIAAAICAPQANSQKQDAAHANRRATNLPMATAERLESGGWWPTKGTASADEFVGPAECARCHAKITASQRTTPMAQAASLPPDAAVLRRHPRVARELQPYTYTLLSAGSITNYAVRDALQAAVVQVGWAMGLGNKGQTYVYERSGNYFESRMSFYKSLQGLDLTTGHEATQPRNLDDALGRLLDAASAKHCFGCHTTGAMTRAGFAPAQATMGVTCEACHGPGAQHVALMDEEKNEEGRAAIFDPGALGAAAQVDFCGACHRTANDVYELGMTGVQTARFQPYRLEQSRCWGDGDARLKCTACHDPHQPLVHDAESYDEKCLACHAAAGTNVTQDRPGKACPVAKKNCVTCHMPRVAVPSMHAPFVDHRIRIVRAKEAYPD